MLRHRDFVITQAGFMEQRPQFDVVIVGAGLIGSSIAYHLSQRKETLGDIALMDLDFSGKFSSSELNAGGIRAEWWHQVNIDLSKATLAFMEKNPDEFGFRQNGYLWLFDRKLWQVYKAHSDIFKRNCLAIKELTPKEVTAWIPCMDRMEGVEGAILMPNDGIFNPNLLKQYYRRCAKKNGVSFLDGAFVENIVKKNKRVEIVYRDIQGLSGRHDERKLLEILTQKKIRHSEEKKRLECGILVNACGAWAVQLAAMYGHRVPCQPIRRQVSIFDCRNLDLSLYGMIVDTSGVYFHAEADHVLAGYATPDEPTGYNFKYDGDLFFEKEIWPRLMNRMSLAEALKHVTGWAGLYSQTPDRSGILGRVDPDYCIYEAHSFTGRGAMQSYGVGLALSELIGDGRFHSIQADALHPNRFHKPSGKLLYEGFYI